MEAASGAAAPEESSMEAASGAPAQGAAETEDGTADAGDGARPAANEFGYVPGVVDPEARTYSNEALGLVFEFPESCTVSDGVGGNEECRVVAPDRDIAVTFEYALSGVDDEGLRAYVDGFHQELLESGDGLDYQIIEIDILTKKYPAIMVRDTSQDPEMVTIWAFIQRDGHVVVAKATTRSYDVSRSTLAGFVHPL